MKSETQIKLMRKEIEADRLELSLRSTRIVATPAAERSPYEQRFLHLGAGTPEVRAMVLQLDLLDWILS